MTGRISIKIKDSNNSYTFELNRNITILCGDSGRGKTTLFEIVEDYNRYGKASASRVVCNKPVIAFRGDSEWQLKLEKINGSVVIIDEDSTFIRSEEFAAAIRGSDNYYLLITRDYLSNLPFSVDEIYELTGKNNKKFKKIYKGTDHMYDAVAPRSLPFKPDLIITEDSKSGYQFFKHISNLSGIECVSAQGKSNIYKLLAKHKDKRVLVVADGAAFGPEMRDVAERQRLHINAIGIFLPESFECMILKSGLVGDSEAEKITAPENYADSCKFFSWEQYFTELLVEITRDSEYMKYPNTKRSLPKYYLQEKSVDRIKALMTGIDLLK